MLQFSYLLKRKSFQVSISDFVVAFFLLKVGKKIIESIKLCFYRVGKGATVTVLRRPHSDFHCIVRFRFLVSTPVALQYVCRRSDKIVVGSFECSNINSHPAFVLFVTLYVSVHTPPSLFLC